MEPLRDWLIQIGWTRESSAGASIAAALLVSYLIGLGLRLSARVPLHRFLKTSEVWREAIARWRVVPRTARVVVVVAATFLVLPLLEPWPKAHQLIETLFEALILLVIAGAISGFIAALVDTLSQRDIREQRLPIKFLGQALQMTLWTYVTVALLSVFTGKDVVAVLTGLTAVGALLAFVFRDPLLGWTAGVQMAANDLVRHGDWISVPQHDADGTVEEISLTTVKVRNWDKSISAVPSYALFSQGFRNWRGMYNADARRIKRAIAIDAASVRFCDDKLLGRLRRSPLMQEIFQSTDEGSVLTFNRESWTSEQETDADALSALRPTNLSCFRAWLTRLLEQHPKVHGEMISMVRERDSNGRGIPVEVWVYTNDTRWEHYEELQAEILDHMLAVLPEFDLRVFQEPTGEDLRALSETTHQASK